MLSRNDEEMARRTKTIRIKKGLIFNDGLEIEFEGDFPKLNKVYEELIGYLKVVMKNV